MCAVALAKAVEAPPRASNDPGHTKPPIDPRAPLLTVSGESVRLITTEGRIFPLVGYIGQSSSLTQWHIDGTARGGDPALALVNKPRENKVLYAAIFQTAEGTVFTGSGFTTRRFLPLSTAPGHTVVGIAKFNIDDFLGQFWEDDE